MHMYERAAKALIAEFEKEHRTDEIVNDASFEVDPAEQRQKLLNRRVSNDKTE